MSPQQLYNVFVPGAAAEAEAIQRSLDYAPHYLCRILIKLLNNI